MTEENNFDDYASKIWDNEPSVAKDRIRWHTSNYHIKAGQLTIDDTIADALEVLDIIPEEVGISVSTEEWQKKYMDDPRMIVAMAKLIYRKLNKHERYNFNHEPNWEAVAIEYMKKEAG